ncbi:MAG: endonuclease/exonuclease/phosphatase family protein [Rikenellaceae bacterium]
MTRVIHIIIIATIFIAGAAIAVSAWFLTTEWRPEPIEVTRYPTSAQPSQINLSDTLEVVSWNIGYAGLGEGMDFFYDGGKQMRCSEAETRENLNKIIAQLNIFAKSADFILLQEVDENSHRSYSINMREAIAEALPEFTHAWAYNYRANYIPMPLGDPMGRVNSGVMILSRHTISRSVRHQYPNHLTFPRRLFLLKRAMLSAEIRTADDRILWLNNTHNSAFDDGEGRRSEVKRICEIIEGQPLSITAGDWNSTPPHYSASEAALNNRFFHPIALNKEDLPNGLSFATDLSTPTMRYLDKPYRATSSTVCNIDFGVVSNHLRIINCTVVDLQFKNSDHNPIIFWVNSADI